MDSPILIDMWTVEPEQQDELVRAMSANVQRLAVTRPGFVSAEIYQSANGDTVLLELRMRSTRDRQALTDDPEVQAVFRELRKFAISHRHLYRLAQSFGAQPPPAKD